MYLGQVRAIFVDEDLARSGLADLADQLFQLPFVPKGTPLAVVDGPLLPLLKAKLVGTELAARFVDLYFRSIVPKVVTRVPLWTFFVDLHTPGMAPMLPVLRLEDAAGGPTLAVEGTAIFRGGRMVQILSGVNNQGLLLWRNAFARQVLSVPAGSAVATIDDAKAATTYRLQRWENGQPLFLVRVRVSGTIHTDPFVGEMFTRQGVQWLQQQTSQQVAAEVEGTLGALQAADADAIGLGAWLYYHDPRAFARLQPWPQTFARLRVDVRVTTSLQTTGWHA